MKAPRDRAQEVARARQLAAQMTHAMEQAGASMYHLGRLAASAYKGALAGGMDEERASDVADVVLAHLMHTALPMPDDEDDGDVLVGGA